ncbi:MAG TPA: PP2C family protein-serine/threonine phosphatase [Nocardioides sp.]|nr:PP2C family protein-serine/threonine phosphatase [Nocardioides sp.]
MDDSYADAGLRLFENMLARTHMSTPSGVGDIIAEELERTLDASAVAIYLINLEQTVLVPVPRNGHPDDGAQDVEGSMAGRSYAGTTILSAPGSETGRMRFFVPIVDGTERLGTLRAELPVVGRERMPEDLTRLLERYGHATAQVLLAKRSYGDALHRVERSRPMDLGAELLASVLPPATFATDGLVISAMVQPAYENGGDAFDYAVNDEAIHLAVFDAVGHGLHAARLSTFAVGVYRNCRRAGQGLLETYATMDAALAEQFGRDTFTTGVLAELDPETGALRWVSAGHPSPLLLRGNQDVKTLDATRATPFGMPMFGTEPTIAEERLQAGDILVLYTDGVTEARYASGALLGVEGLTGLLQRDAAEQQPPPETLRRLRRSLTSADGPTMRDDATVLVAHWHRGAERTLLPQTV